jgi:hypothetical protein
MRKFRIEQIALAPTNTNFARGVLKDLGLTEWVDDHVTATGEVHGEPASNEANLSFNYEASNCGLLPLELELLEYTAGENWIQDSTNVGDSIVSHLGMHCTAEELEEYRAYFKRQGFMVAQEVDTTSHTNPAIKDSRRYKYVIFGTRHILGVDLKFIVRKNIE